MPHFLLSVSYLSLLVIHTSSSPFLLPAVIAMPAMPASASVLTLSLCHPAHLLELFVNHPWQSSLPSQPCSSAQYSLFIHVFINTACPCDFVYCKMSPILNISVKHNNLNSTVFHHVSQTRSLPKTEGNNNIVFVLFCFVVVGFCLLLPL